MDVFAGEAFSEGVKTIDADDFARNLAHKLAAAGVGCIVASAKNQSCDAGAIGAAVGEIVGDYLVEQGNESNLTAKDKKDILNRAKLVAGTVALAVGADVDTAANSAGVAVENNSLKVATTVIKVSGKIFKVAVKKGKVTIKDLKDILRKEGFDIVDSLITLGDGQVDINDAKAIIDLVVGTSLNKANKGEAALRINSIINRYCFVAGTLIETIDGLKPIETIQQGDLVWSRHEETLEYGYRPVTGTASFDDKEIYEVVVQDSNGNTETYQTTEEHPFWVVSAGWLPAKMLQAGMTLVNRDNQETLKVVSQKKLAKTDTVYNFEVDDFHTYHIGEFGVWVHNACVKKFSNLNNTTNDRIQKLAKGYNDITVGKSVINLERVGNRNRAGDFAWLSAGGKVIKNTPDIKISLLPDGSKVISRLKSSNGHPTVEIQSATGKALIKIRY